MQTGLNNCVCRVYFEWQLAEARRRRQTGFATESPNPLRTVKDEDACLRLVCKNKSDHLSEILWARMAALLILELMAHDYGPTPIVPRARRETFKPAEPMLTYSCGS